MHVVHFSLTALAGAPIRLVDLLAQHTCHEVRLVSLTRAAQYRNDVVFSETPETAMSLAERADILHVHNAIDLDCRAFAPIDFRALRKRGKLVIRHFHTHPKTIARLARIPLRRVTSSELPALVIAQFQERFFPNARVVRNVIPLGQAASDLGDGVCFTPSAWRDVWASRWDTKAAPETVQLLNGLHARTGVRVDVVTGQSLEAVLEAKRRAAIVIDDLWTGSYHLSGLEGLALGRAVCCHLDSRTRAVLERVSGSTECPFVSVALHDAGKRIEALLDRPGELRQWQQRGRKWMESHWSEQSCAVDIDAIYRELAHDPTQVTRQSSLRVDTPEARRLAVSVPERAYLERRRAQWKREPLTRRAIVAVRLARKLVLR